MMMPVIHQVLMLMLFAKDSKPLMLIKPLLSLIRLLPPMDLYVPFVPMNLLDAIHAILMIIVEVPILPAKVALKAIS